MASYTSGYDHQTEEEEAEMTRLQRNLEAYGLKHVMTHKQAENSNF